MNVTDCYLKLHCGDRILIPIPVCVAGGWCPRTNKQVEHQLGVL